MVNGYSIRKCAKIVDISIPTSFYWRHKNLDAIRAYMRIGSVGGVVELMMKPFFVLTHIRVIFNLRKI
jgi:hypothetical protein